MSRRHDRRDLFCAEYIKDFNGSRAAIDAGYAKDSARVQAFNLLSNEKVIQKIEELKLERMGVVKVDSNYVLKRLLQIDCLDVLEIVDDEMNVKPISEWPVPWRTSVSALDLSKISSGDDIETVLTKIKMPDKLKNLELIGRHTSVGSWEKDSGSNEGVSDLLKDLILSKQA